MTIPRPADGHGSSLTFGGFNANIISIDPAALKRAAIDSTHLGTTDAMDAIAAKLVDPGEVSCSLQFDPSALPPIQGDPGVLTITFASETEKTWSWANAFFTSFKPDSVKTGGLMTATATIKVTCLPTIS